MILTAQIIGTLAMIFNIASFQCKKNRHLVFMLGLGSLLFCVSFTMLGAIASAGFNIINILRSVCISKKRLHSNAVFFVLCFLYTIITALASEGLWTIMLLISQIIATYSQWYKDGTVIRKMQFFVVSPVWLINNIFVTFTIGGIICEIFTIVSVIVSFIRYRKNGFEI